MWRNDQIAHGRFKLFLAILLGGVIGLSLIIPVTYAIVLAFDAASLVFLTSAAIVWRSGTAGEMRKNAARDDGGRSMLLAISTIAIAVILVVLIAIIGGTPHRTASILILVIVTQLLAWIFANVVWAFHYAHLFYDPVIEGNDSGGLVFPGEAQPEFSDFCYFSIVIGMTFQVSDVEITSPHLRKIATAHGLVAFFYNLGVLALTVNLIAGTL